MPDQSASGKHIVITGGTSGVGLETARLMVAAGGDVFIVGSDPEKAIGPSGRSMRPPAQTAMPHSSGPTSRRWRRFVDWRRRSVSGSTASTC